MNKPQFDDYFKDFDVKQDDEATIVLREALQCKDMSQANTAVKVIDSLVVTTMPSRHDFLGLEDGEGEDRKIMKVNASALRHRALTTDVNEWTKFAQHFNQFEGLTVYRATRRPQLPVEQR
jgi:hypothetical protein